MTAGLCISYRSSYSKMTPNVLLLVRCRKEKRNLSLDKPCVFVFTITLNARKYFSFFSLSFLFHAIGSLFFFFFPCACVCVYVFILLLLDGPTRRVQKSPDRDCSARVRGLPDVMNIDYYFPVVLAPKRNPAPLAPVSQKRGRSEFLLR